MVKINLSHNDPLTLSTTTLVLAVLNDEEGVSVLAPSASKKQLAALNNLAHDLNVTGGEGQFTRSLAPTELKAQYVAFVGLDDRSPEQLRRAAGVTTRALAKTDSCVFGLPTTDVMSLEAVCEGALNGTYVYNRYFTTPKEQIGTITVATPMPRKEANQVLQRAEIITESMSITRDFINTAPNELYPDAFAKQAEKLAKSAGINVKIYDEKMLLKEGCGGIVGVGQGSSRPPRMVRLEWKPRGANRTHALIGKGITFDTGGISLKPPKGMDAMRSDMSGAAIVLGTLLAVAKIKVPVHVVGWLALAENMPGANAQRPGDVVKCRNGKTVEVLNTDAEGRMVMADALSLAAEEKPDTMLDIATITGAAIVALGNRIAAVMGSDDVREAILEASESTGESFWPMPLPTYLRDKMKSTYADIANISNANGGGMLSAGLFLQEFTNGIAWAHLDVAGPAYNEGSPWGQTPSGGTGFGVPTLISYLEDALN